MNYQVNIPKYCTNCLKQNNLTNFNIKLEDENQPSENQSRDKRENQIYFPICTSCKTKMKQYIRKYSAMGFIISSILVLSILLFAINQYRLNLYPTTAFLELQPTILGAIVILVYVGILVMPAIFLIGIIRPETFMKYPVKLQQNNKNSIAEMFSFKNVEYSKLFADANRKAKTNLISL